MTLPATPPTTSRQAIVLSLLALLPGLILHAALLDAQLLMRLLTLVVIGGAVEAVASRFHRKAMGWSWLLTAVVLAVALPATLPFGLLVLAGGVAALLGRGALRGAGFNPAMLAYAVIAVLLPASMYGGVDAHSGATLLTRMGDGLREQQTLGEILDHGGFDFRPVLVALVWLGGGLWLMRRRILGWRISLGMLLGLGLCALLPWMLDTDRHVSPLLHLFSGSFVFAALYVATEPASAPRDDRARLLYGLGIGALVYAMRVWGDFADGIAFAVLLMNFLAPLLDRHYARRSAAPTA